MENTDQLPKYCFLGTDNFSVTVLEALNQQGYLPSLIITVTDKPAGRKMKLTPPPVKTWSQNHNIPHYQTNKINREDILKEVPTINEVDLFLVASFGQILPEDFINLPQYGTLNIHPSLLPKYRGPTPIEACLLNNDQTTGVSIMLLDKKMDHGPIFKQKEININLNDTYTILEKKLAQLGAELFLETVRDIGSSPKPQNHAEATFTKKFTKEDGEIKNNDTEQEKYNKFRAFHKNPGVFFFIKKNNQTLRVKIIEAELITGEFKPKKIIPAGGKEMKWEDFERNLPKD